MTTQRKRSNRTVGTKLNKMDSEIEALQGAAYAPQENSVGEAALQTNSVGPGALQPDSVNSEAVGRGAIGTENLGTVNEVTSDSVLSLNAPTAVSLSGGAYPSAVAGRRYNVQLDDRGYLVANLSTSATRVANIDPLYTAGMPKVTFAGESTLSGPYAFNSGYKPVPGQEVVLIPNGAGFYTILGSTVADIDYPYQVSMNLTSYSTGYEDPAFTKTASGIVVLKGMVSSSSSGLAAGTVLFTLPDGFRPDTYLDFGVSGNSAINRVTVRNTGEVIMTTAVVANQWITLQGIRFPAAGVATWTPIQPDGTALYTDTKGSVNMAFANGMVDSGLSQYGAASYWADPYGYLWFRGYMRSTTTMSANAVTINMGNGYQPSVQYHIPSVAFNNTWCYIAVNPSGAIHGTSTSTAVNYYQSLAGLFYPAPVLSPTSPTPVTTFLNSWVNYGSGYPVAAYIKRPDGLVWMQGLVKSGTVGSSIFTLPSGIRPSKRSLAVAPSNAAFARIDVVSDGSVITTGGSNAWYSLDARVFVAEG